MGDTRMVAGRSRPATPRISAAAPGTLTGRPTGVEYRSIRAGEYRFIGERCTAGGTVMLWHSGRRVGRVAENVEGAWKLYAFQACRGWLTGATAAEVLTDTVRAFGLRQPVSVR